MNLKDIPLAESEHNTPILVVACLRSISDKLPNINKDIDEYIKEHPEELEKADSEGYTPLLTVCRNILHDTTDTKLFEILLKHGANVNATTIRGDTALSLSECNANFDYIKILLEHPEINDSIYYNTRHIRLFREFKSVTRNRAW